MKKTLSLYIHKSNNIYIQYIIIHNNILYLYIISFLFVNNECKKKNIDDDYLLSFY